jgi:DNA-binding transcriptional regulator LsrR (DeoR family)
VIGYGAFLAADEQAERIRRLYRQGWTPDQLAPLFGLSREKISRMVEDLRNGQDELELSRPR